MNTGAKKYDSDMCGSLPLHFVNQVQPHGVLLVLDKNTFQIIQASENISQVLDVPVDTLLGQSIEKYILPAQAKELREKFRNEKQEKLPLTLTFSTENHSNNLLALIHVKEQYLLLEIETLVDNPLQDDTSFLGVYQQVKYVMAAMDMATTVEEISNIAIQELQKLSGFDRIMIYQFDEDWNGTVIAEVMNGGWGQSYLGLRFPASDIPPQARALYQRNPYRLIPNREYTPVKLYPVINPITHAFTDLSDCNLRSVAGVHIEYLKNMGVTASMSTRILVNNQLWGLIACHHRTPKYLSYASCSVFELLSNIISARITSLHMKDTLQRHTQLVNLHTTLIDQLYQADSLPEAFGENMDVLLEFLNCTGVVIVDKKQLVTAGNVPPTGEIQELVFWLQSRNRQKVYTEIHLPGVFEQAFSYADIASGLIVLPVREEMGEYILGFRPAAEQQVNWGGNPNEAINFEADKKNYHPRNSFRLWKETVRNTSLPWTAQEIAMAEQFRNSLVEFTLKKIYA